MRFGRRQGRVRFAVPAATHSLGTRDLSGGSMRVSQLALVSPVEGRVYAPAIKIQFLRSALAVRSHGPIASVPCGGRIGSII